MSIVLERDGLVIRHGDARAELAELPAESVDSVVTDPPYDLVAASRGGSSRVPGTGPFGRHREGTKGGGFMGHEWDATGVAFDPETWRAVLRVAKPGAWLLAFGGTRTYHRMATAIEEAGWQITDQIVWLYAQGMPKGVTTLKPAHEPIVLARKVAKRAAPLQIDEARIPFDGTEDEAESKGKNQHAEYGTEPGRNRVYGDFSMVPVKNYDAGGRWPANVMLTDPVLDRGVADVTFTRVESSAGHRPAARGASGMFSGDGGGLNGEVGLVESRLGSGSFSRYFLVPKANRTERSAGIDDLEEQPMLWSSGTQSPGTFQSAGTKRAARNNHPTVKPLALMDHLVRLVTPSGGVVLDPFVGSGTTAIAALASGRRCVAIDQDAHWLAIAIRRLRLLRQVSLEAVS